jgi:thioredoxin reductase
MSVMRKIFFTILTIVLIIPQTTLQADISDQYQQCYEWAVIGAGFAGITAVAVLIDSRINPSTIAWIDPDFTVGKVGKYYRNVPGNGQICHLIEYVEKCPYFKNITSHALDALYSYDLEQFQLLHVIVDPLLDFTAYLQKMVVPIQNTITSLVRMDDCWLLESSDGRIIRAQKVILAIGAEPKRLDYNIPEIPLDEAFDKERLMNTVCDKDCIAVFGGMHSAMLVLKYLSECSVGKITNFYLRDYFYGMPGLEGEAALWAKNVLEKNPPKNLVRVLNTVENRKAILPSCSKVIYAIGYQSNKISINGSLDITFDEHTGIIDENIYGIGIAFPPTAIFNGQKIAKNGLLTYLAYAKKLIPRWINNEKSFLFDDSDIELPWI